MKIDLILLRNSDCWFWRIVDFFYYDPATLYELEIKISNVRQKEYNKVM